MHPAPDGKASRLHRDIERVRFPRDAPTSHTTMLAYSWRIADCVPSL